MGFKVPKRIAILSFDTEAHPDFAGAEIRARLDISTEAFFQIEGLRERVDGADDKARIRSMLDFFVDNIALSWNFEDDDGNPYPLTTETLMRELPPALTLNIIPLWKEAAVGVSAPLVEPSSSPDSLRETSTPTPEPSSESQSS